VFIHGAVQVNPFARAHLEVGLIAAPGISDRTLMGLVATSFQPQIVLLDLGVPGLTGHAVAQQLRRTPETKKCHVSGYYRMGTTGGSAKVKGSWV